MASYRQYQYQALAIPIATVPAVVVSDLSWLVQSVRQPRPRRRWSRDQLFYVPLGDVVTHVKIDVSTLGDNTIVSAAMGSKIRVQHLFIVPDAPVIIKWKSGSTDISGPMRLVASGGYGTSLEFGVIETNASEALILNLSAAVSVGGHLVYTLI
jgi:hypothetical protein